MQEPDKSNRHFTGDERWILVFGDGSIETQSELSHILRANSKGPLLSDFLEKARHALCQERSKISSRVRDCIPDFQNSLDDFIVESGKRQQIPALHPAEIIVTQIASFIHSYEQAEKRGNRRRWPSSTGGDLIVGLCFGELSAGAVALSSNITELVSIGVEAVCIAFRTGVAAQTLGNAIEPYNTATNESWSVALSAKTGLDDEETLDTLGHHLSCTQRRRPYVCAKSRKTVTLGGPPSTLRKVLAHVRETSNVADAGVRSRVPIHAPYHAHHLYAEHDVYEILDKPDTLTLSYTTFKPSRTTRNLISGYSGSHYDASSGRHMLELSLYNILAQPILWEHIVDGCVKQVDAIPATNRIVWNVGPAMMAESLARSLDKCCIPSIQYGGSFLPADWLQDQKMDSRQAVAIVGMAGRFPQAATLGSFWRNLEQGLDCHQVIPSDRFNAETHLQTAPFGCFIDDPGMFDCRFFNMSPREALETDPGQRLALVTAYEALEMSGFVADRTSSSRVSRIGSFFGQVCDEYKEQNMAQHVGTYFIPGSMRAFGPGRINHFFKFGGPAYNVDTACSSSLVALSVACKSIQLGECDTAVVGGMNICCSSDNYQGLVKGHFLSPTGGCKVFDESADGYCRGEAVASVVIKRLDAALADNDPILGTILSIATNYNAAASSITRPDKESQKTLFNDLLRQANLKATDIDYIEAHGTGTQQGDVVETASITEVFGTKSAASKFTDNREHLLGAVKANIGHGEAAAGVTALIKTLLTFENDVVPRHIGLKKQLNPRLPDLSSHGIILPMENTPFTKLRSSHKRRALVNNFSAAGGNTAMLLEAPDRQPVQKPKRDPRQLHVVTVSAKSTSSLQKNLQNLIQYIELHSNLQLPDIAYTTTARRAQYRERVAICADSVASLVEGLSNQAQRISIKSSSPKRPIAFAFSGQGGAVPSTAKELFATLPSFRNDVIYMDKLCVGMSLPSFLAAIDGTEPDSSHLHPCQNQLALVALEIALAHSYNAWGVQPDLLVGHSLGEYAMLCVAGVLSTSDTLWLVGFRAQLIEENLKPGVYSMLAVNLSRGEVDKHLKTYARLDIAAINGPNDTVVSGSTDDVAVLREFLGSKAVRCKLLEVPYGFHSHQMIDILSSFERACRNVHFYKPQIPVFSSLLGCSVAVEGVFGPDYLLRHSRERVNFASAIDQAREMTSGDITWLECGPNPLCLPMIRKIYGHEVHCHPMLRSPEPNWATIAKTLATLYSDGHDIDWHRYHEEFVDHLQVVRLPSYAFDDKNYWIPYENDWLLHKFGEKASPASHTASKAFEGATPALQRITSRSANENDVTITFESTLNHPDLWSIVKGHKMNNHSVCPASLHTEIAFTIGNFVRSHEKVKVSTTGMSIVRMDFKRPISVLQRRELTIKVLQVRAIADLASGSIDLRYTVDEEDVASACVLYGDVTSWMSQWSRNAYLFLNRFQLLSSNALPTPTHRLYQKMAYELFSPRVDYDPDFQAIQEVLLNSDALECAASIRLDKILKKSFYISPYWLDVFAHVAGFLVNANENLNADRVYMCTGWDSWRFGYDIDPSQEYRIHVKMHNVDKNLLAGAVSILQDEKMVGEISDLRFQEVPTTLLHRLVMQDPTPMTNSKPQGVWNSESAVGIKELDVASVQPKSDRQKERVNGTNPARVNKHANSPTKKVMSPEEVDSVLDAVLAQEIGVRDDELRDGMLLATLGVDSLLLLELNSKIAETFAVEVGNLSRTEETTVGELRQKVLRNIKSDATATNGVADVMPETPNSCFRNRDSLLHAPSKRSTAELKSIIAECIGVHVTDLDTTSNLADFGVDSLMTLTIIDALSERHGMTVRPDQISGSITDIERSLGLSNTRAVENTHVNGITDTNLATSRSKTRSTLSVLLQSSPMAAECTLFLLPDGSGTAASYAKLPQISRNICIYALNSPYLHSLQDYDSVESVSRKFYDEIRYRQPRGPYFLGGWSAGGYYAYEVMKILMQSGETVEKLILIDSPCRTVYEALPADLMDYLISENLLGEVGSQPPDWVLQHFKTGLTKVADYVPTPVSGTGMPEVYIIWATEGVKDGTTLEELGLDAEKKVSNLLLKKREHFQPQGWEILLPSAKTWLAKTPGHHFQIVYPPYVQSLATLIIDAMCSDDISTSGRWKLF